MNDLSEVREGMDVINAEGKKIGTVKSVKMGDPQAVTPEGQTQERGGLVSFLAGAFSTEEVDEERAQRLLRLGYIHVDGTGIGNNFYEAADAVERIDDAGVHLSSSAASR
ncbi:hypothetical protein GCM10009784_07510 [Arthrobacter parietis]|uniref:PRC-barrel domain-containing protein n=2 Tax=Arthrobacter TaxID=1663 RepID=A0ABT6CYU8_9MICC|nr:MULTISPECIES: hypothetical protein [Arthrobacter]KRF08735.1 hypothetical protein ASH00_03295 [Arthrobacter sp. Soil782]MDF9278204.1 hypothetical protein [Arthrobacter vasquezii]